MLENVFIINLDFKTDRRERILKEIPLSLAKAKIWKAIHGDTVKHPPWWTAGKGAWGCYRSHVSLLEHCYNSKLDSYMVLEDDATFVQDFDERLDAYMKALPEDWEMAYIGGQLLEEIKHPPVKINDLVYLPYDVNRTHGFIVHNRGYEKLYHWLVSQSFENRNHIDHHFGKLHRKQGIKVYVPDRWLVGQMAGWSNISGKYNKTLYWPDPCKCGADHQVLSSPRLIFLEAPLEVANDLQQRGWHQGNWRTSDGLDRGVCNAIASRDIRTGLRDWYAWIQREVIRDDLVIPCLYHPSLTVERVRSCNLGEVIHIVAETTDEALEQWSKYA
jgi:GR25 family glycosyltransferase involved in LPS biosynthesis